MKSCTTMLGIRSYSITFDFPPHRAVLEDVLDGRLLEPVAVVRDGGLDDARERDVVLGVSQEQVPARWRNVEGQGRRDGVSRRFAEEGDQIFS